MPDHIKILVVDPNAGALAALRDSLSSASDLEFVGDAGLGPVALTWARTLQPDVVVVAIEELRAIGARSRTVRLTERTTWS